MAEYCGVAVTRAMGTIVDKLTMTTFIALALSIIGFVVATAGVFAAFFITLVAILLIPSVFPPKPKTKKETSAQQ